jgi:hypothetical protein
MALAALGLTPAQKGFASQPTKWEDMPEAVRATVLANGGSNLMRVAMGSGELVR